MYTRWGVKRRICTNKNSRFLRFWNKMEGLPEITRTVLEQRILIISILYSVSLLASCILLAIHWFLIPLIKTSWRVPNVLQQVDKKFIPIVASTAPDITDQVYFVLCIIGHFWFLMNFLIIHFL